MTSANVSNMTMQVAVSTSAAGKADAQNQSSDFMQVMSQSLQGDKQSDSSMPDMDKKDTSLKVDRKPGEIKDAKKPEVDQETATKIMDEAEEFAEEVKDVISEELGVSEEAIEEAMEILGLTILDLTDKTNLAQLVSKLTNCESNVELLMNDNFVDIASHIRNLTEELLADTQCSVKELQTVLDANIQVDTSDLVKTDEVAAEMPKLAETQQEQDVPVVNQEEAMPETEEVAPVITSSVDTKKSDVSDEAEESTREMKPQENVTTTTTQNLAESKNDFGNEHMSRRDDNLVFQHQEHGFGLTEQTVVSQYEPMTGEITLQSGEVVDVQNIIDQIVENARTTISTEDTTIEMLLNPEGLGKILMEVTHRDGKVIAHIYTQDENVKEALEHQMIQLKDQMNQGGTKVTSIEVSVGTHEFERNLEEGQQQRQQEEAETKGENRRTRNLNLNNLDELSGLMTEEEELVTKMMRENGNSVNYTA